MGKWAKGLFGEENFGSVGIVITGSSTIEFEKEILGMFDEVLYTKDSVYHSYLVRKNEIHYPIVFNIYGAPAMVDVVTKMQDGGCNNIIFVGHAYGGFKNLDIGSIVLPDRSYHFDGIYHFIEPDRKFIVPDEELIKIIKKLFIKQSINYVEGSNISVPAVTFQMPHANDFYREIKPLTCEMELSACLSRAKDIGIRAIGILIVSDNRKYSISAEDKHKLREPPKRKIIKLVIDNIKNFDLKQISNRRFNVNEYLANIIYDPEDSENIYEKNY